MWAFALALPTTLASIAAAAERTRPSMFDPVSTPAFAIRELSYRVFGITGLIFVVVAGLAVYTLIRFRSRAGDERGEPPQIYGSTQIEIAWTVVPLIIVVVLFLVTARYIYGIERRAMPAGALEVTVVGHQWWWEIRYPGLGIVTANEIHVPVSDPAGATPTFLTLESVDVVHSFWVPQLAGKMDVVPNKTNRMWIDPRTPGTYVGQCAEYCGTQHAWMLLLVVVHPRDEFERWVAAQRAAGPRRGRRPGRVPALPLTGVHQLPHGPRHPCQRGVRAGPHASHEPTHHRGRRREQYPGGAAARGWTTRPRSSPGS